MSTNRQIFNHIAESWYSLKHWSRFSKELEDIADRWKSGRLLNIGCAHGPDFLPFKNSFELHGVDFSLEMIRQAFKHAEKFKYDVNLLTADAVLLPYKSDSFDFAIAVASYHHIRPQKQHQAFNELARVLRPEGEAFLTVWNRWQKRFWKAGKELYVPWQTRDQILNRYYYLFSCGELVRKLKAAEFDIVAVFPEYGYRKRFKCFSRNICVLVRKGH
jgi:SAM-dependent methyltransferase